MTTATSHGGGVSITFDVNGSGNQTKTYDLMVVACDPRALEPVLTYRSDETAVFDKLQNFQFHTTLVTMKRTETAKYGVIFSPKSNEEMVGDIYAFRNETAKQFGMDTANALDENLYTVYQIAAGPRHAQGKPPAEWTAQDFEKRFHDTIHTLDWWHNGDIVGTPTNMTTPYFDHFGEADIKAEWPWKYLALQGKSNTLFVHASTCFESALHCWGYIRDLTESYAPSMAALPPDSANGKVAIIGAGVSGILAANRLVRLGYHPENIDILEKTDRFGGKTHTVYKEGPHPEGGQHMTVCEMGTCYMSPSYDPMLKDLARYVGGNSQIDFAAKEPNFRGIDTTGEFDPPIAGDQVIPYEDYLIAKAARILDHWYDIDVVVEFDIAEKMVEYINKHHHYFKGQMPMPLQPPAEFLAKYGDKTFGEYLIEEGMAVLVPAMEYAYEVQGYGSVVKIPALYGLIWVTPPIFEAILESKVDTLVDLAKPKIVTAWSQGWEQLWAQIVTIDKLNISLNTNITNIMRH